MDCVVNKKMLPDADSLEDLNSEDIIIAVRIGGTAVAAAKRFAPKAELHQFDSDPAIIQDVLNNNAHAAFSATPKPAFWAVDYPDVLYRLLGGELLTFEPTCFAVRKGDPDAMFFFNSWIRDQRNFLEERNEYWFQTKNWNDRIVTE